MEKLDFRNRSSLAKSIGTMVSIAGALTVTLYKGPPIAFAQLPNTLHHELLASVQSNWITGGFLLVAASFCLALLFIVQVNMTKPLKCLHPLCVTKLNLIFFFIYKDLDYEGLPCSANANTHLLHHCDHPICHGLFGCRERPECLATKA